ncbi:MarR family winged helix-turn-helix transcriptional regulator [Microbacterium sp. A94]|uniref:MarR family winged helix-turn-helix transcriptional regulator n=1 Tax=Microbacterium sp. A94 TaxID=3450717 RepID=UPI003F43E178
MPESIPCQVMLRDDLRGKRMADSTKSATSASPSYVQRDVEDLDSSLAQLRRMLQHPYYRDRLLGALDDAIELGTLRVLRAVERADEALPAVGTIADALGIDPSTASRMVNRTVELGLLQRTPSAQDRRRMQLKLTVTGQRCLERATSERRILLGELTQHWSGDELHAFVDLMNSMLDSFWRQVRTRPTALQR